ncbi:hypothetical protein KIN20_014290 [Parelaphostrongylus tenuis]|uniref:Uncharacterized protein n=1 Tax=Parelaphostrongylus tenuis TaxID=148309 RepID=A0AAD5QPA6_PARTN|nr:hypothetical protein KIN20_014290 [Parelaphostrongylus tenuis]
MLTKGSTTSDPNFLAGYSLPVAMAFSTVAAALTQILYILQNSRSAEAFVERLIIQELRPVMLAVVEQHW